MRDDKFLQQVANYYIGCKSPEDFADIIFICPNKRSAMFLKSYTQQRVKGEAVLMPRFTTFGKFISRRAVLPEGSRNDRLFTLYTAYRKVLKRHGRTDQAKDFDKFIFWGDMILSDFDTIDSSLASAGQLYKNLHDLRGMTADFLTNRQKQVIRDIWGDTSMTGYVDTFWMHTDERDSDGNEKQVTRKFIALWEILGEVYDTFVNDMTARGLTTKGMQARMAVEQVESEAADSLRRNTFVFVGQSDLTTAEVCIMKRLKEVGAAEFIWDLPQQVFETAGANRAAIMIRNLARKFPMPDDFTLQQIDTKPEIDIIGVASGVGQAKEAASIISKLKSAGQLDTPEQLINTAVVLPEPSLLIPLMTALPASLDKINITMSLPASATTFATLLRVIIALQRNCRRRSDGRHTFFFKDVLEVLQHPHINVIAPGEAETIRTEIRKQRLYNLDSDELVKGHPALSYIFKCIGEDASAKETYLYLKDLIEGLAADILRVSDPEQPKPWEVSLLERYGVELDRLYQNIIDYGIEMHESTFIMLFERILCTDPLTLTGTPLQGLQIMGVLETRALDFDNIIYLSMNERTFPRRDYVRTMIPNNLRRGYGLPPIEHNESFYSYYFFRSLCRARRVTLVYDSRPGRRGGGEISRYISQLMYLSTGYKMRHYATTSTALPPEKREISIVKTPEVMRELMQLQNPGKIRLSASALKSYMKCPLQFYLQYIKGMRESTDPEGYLDAATMGNILHHAIRLIYKPYEGHFVNHKTISNILESDVIEKEVERQIFEQGYHTSKSKNIHEANVEAQMAHDTISRQIRYMFEAELKKYCSANDPEIGFTYIEGEHDVVDKMWQVMPGLEVNFRMQIDRIDRIDNDTLRFIDYKTGTDGLTVGNSIDNLFSGEHSHTGIFQLLLYAEAYNDMVEPGQRIELSLYSLRNIAKTGVIDSLKFNKKPMEPYPALSPIFRPKLNAMIAEIFNPDIPLTQAASTDNCMFCNFRQLCGREEKDDTKF